MTAAAAHVEAPYRALPLGGSLSASFEERGDGSTIVRSTEPLAEYPRRITDRLLHWAEMVPDRTLVAKRVRNADGTRGDWRRVSYAEALATA
ncbi:MAG TPA: feruloyl-CoA synthase, partial [Caldimonas sp.]|nr:feruloyl-CoA synthase [Caldimonas sp.]